MPNYYGSLDDYKKSVRAPKTQIVNPEPPSYDPKQLREQMIARIPQIKAAIKSLDAPGSYGERNNARIMLRSYERNIIKLGKEIESGGGSSPTLGNSASSTSSALNELFGGGLRKGSK